MQLAASAHFERVGESVSATRSATFDSSSRIKRSRIWRDVRNLPSRPANGELLTLKNIETVGSSTATACMPSGASASAIVSPMLRSSIPETQTMSPAVGLLDLDALEPGERQQLRQTQTRP